MILLTGLSPAKFEVFVIDKSKVLKDAQKYTAKAQWDKAILEYEKIVKESPNDANTHNTIGDLHLKKNSSDFAIESYRKAADIFNKTGFTLKAIALYKKILNIKPDQVDVHLLLGKLNAERGLLGNANDCYLAAASYYSRQGQKSKAVDVYKTLCDLNPDNLALATKLAELYMSEGFEREGVSKFIELAEKRATQDDLDGARSNLEYAAAKGSERFDFIRVSALIDFKSNRLAEAASKLEQSRMVDHTDVRINSLLTDVYMRSGKYDEAAALCSDMLELDQNNQELKKQLFEINMKAGDFVAAWGICNSLSHDLAEKNQYAEAEELVRSYLSGRPESVEAVQVLADLLTRGGKEQEAQPLHIKIADIYSAAGETQKALNILKKLQEKEPGNSEVASRIQTLGKADALKSEPSIASIPDTFASAVEPSAPGEKQSSEIPPGEKHPDNVDSGHHPFQTLQDEQPQEELYAPPYSKALAEGTVSGHGIPAASIPGMDIPATLSGGIEGEIDIAGAYADADVSFPGGKPEAAVEDEPPAAKSIQDAFNSLAGDIPEISIPDGKSFEITDDLSNLDELEIFDTGGQDAAPETEKNAAVGGNVIDLSDFDDSPDTGPFQSSAALPNIEEKLDEIDVYLKYGLSQKAEESLERLSRQFPDSELLARRFIDFYKTQGDVDNFTKASIKLAHICAANGRKDEARSTLSTAMRMDPGNEDVSAAMAALFPEEASSGSTARAASAPGISSPKFPEAAERVSVPDRSSSGIKPGLEPDVLNLDDAFSEFEAPAVEDTPGATSGTASIESEAPAQTEAADPARYHEELAEADFYAQQGLMYEAAEIYNRLLAANPDDSEVRRKISSLSGRGDYSGSDMQPVLPDEIAEDDFSDILSGSEVEDVAPAAAQTTLQTPKQETPVIPEISLDSAPEYVFKVSAPASSDEFFDLAAELREEIDDQADDEPVEVFEDKNLESVFREFKKGVEEQLNKEDYETHYNLGIAYKEMGMLDEAISEFLLASKDPSRTLDCASMMGLCYIEKGEYALAVEQFGLGLRMKGRAAEEYMGLKYDLATAYELNGDLLSAQSVINELHAEDPGFREVTDRLKDLNKAIMDAGLHPGATRKPEHRTESINIEKTAKTPVKKNRVSYL